MAKILIADDEALLRRLVADCLKKDGHTVLEAADGEEAFRLFRREGDIALAVLDIMMPELDGWELCKRIRETSSIPIIMLSARSQEFDQILGFENGADDYVTKPFSLAVLSHRIEALLKRGSPPPRKENPDDILLEGLCLRPSAHELFLDGVPVELTLKEFRILQKLAAKPGRVYTREQLLDEVWGMDYDGDVRTVDSHMARLRTKLGDWGMKHIRTVYGTGYKIEEEGK